MENAKASRKELKSLIDQSLRTAIGTLALPKPSKKVDRVITKNSKKLASLYATLLKKDAKKQKIAKKDATSAKAKKEQATKTLKAEKSEAA